MQKDIMLMEEHVDEVVFSIACACHNGAHNVDLIFTLDQDGEVQMDMLYPLISADFAANRCNNWLTRGLYSFWWRIKKAIIILFVGRIDVCGDFLLTGTNVKAFKTAIDYATKKFK